MSDLISRQTAIDALADYIHNVDKVIGTGHLSAEDCKDAATSVLEELPSAKEKPFKLPEIYVADGYDTVMGEDGNVGFGVYVPDEKQIYIAGDVDNEVRLKALFHELCHWAQDMCGRSFDEDEANEFSDIVYDALPSAQPDLTLESAIDYLHSVGWMQIKAIMQDSSARDNVYAEFIKSLKSTDREFVRQILEEFERQEGAEKE